MGSGKGYGKSILFGEHFVVYGLPAIASALGDYTEAKVELTEGTGWELQDERLATPGYKKEKYDEQVDSINRVIDAAGIDLSDKKLKIWFGGNLKAASGVGASAASCAALARALNEEFCLGFDDDKINELAYEGEKGYHGTPSGIDNTAAVFGGLIWFKKNLEGGANTMDKMKSNAFKIVIGNTGKTSSTIKVVGDVKKLKETDEEKFARILGQYDEVANRAKKALLANDLEKVGVLMNKNHELLQKINVSCDELDLMVKTARTAGALGAKLTGTGRGGLMIALVTDSKTQTKVAEAIEALGFDTMKMDVGI
ncbi:MAG: mevalonate kinase [Candidatus Diapherotrites archaeon]